MLHTTRRVQRLGPFVPVLLAFLLGVLVYQLPVRTTMAIGALGDQLVVQSSQAQDDGPAALGQWYPDEQDRGMRYRWTRHAARFTLHDWGAGTGELQLSVAGWPLLEAGQIQPTVTLRQDDVVVGSFTPTADYHSYRFSLPVAKQVDRNLWLQSSAVLTSTAHINDPRPKGIRVNQFSVTSRGGWGLPIGWGSLLALMATTYLATAAVDRRTSHRAVGLLWGCGIAVVGATALQVGRVWAVWALPWAVAVALVGLLVIERRAVGYLWAAWHNRSRLSSMFERGLLVVMLFTVLYGVVALGSTFSLPTLTTLRNNVEGLVAVLPIVGVCFLLVLAGPTRMPHWLRYLRARLLVGRLALVVLGVFLLIWLGWEFTVLQRVPLVGHADYADNAVVARNLLRGHLWQVDYATQFYTLRPNGNVHQPQPTWPLLQPVWIVPFMWLFGPTALAARLPNLVFNLVLALLIFRIGADVWDRRVGTLAAIFTLINQLFFKLTLYATTDLGFVVLSMAALWFFFRACERSVRPDTVAASPRSTQHRHDWGSWALAGLLVGLMVLQKPSGAVFGVGMIVWVALRAIRQRALPWRGLLLWAGVGALTVAPYLVRNWLTFTPHTLFSSTESIDAWVLYYEGSGKDPWRKLYNVYLGDVPNRSWILRWGWDRTLSKIALQARAGLKDLLPPQGYLLKVPLTCLVLLGIGLQHRRQRSLLQLVGLVGLGYGLFLVLYWHLDGEERYLLPFVPWLLLLAMSALCTIYDRLASLAEGRWSGVAGLVLSILLIAVAAPHWHTIDQQLDPNSRDYWGSLWQPSLDAFQWLHDHTASDAVVMSQVPWEMSFYTDRPGLMIPNEPLPTILGVARYYHAQYLVVNSIAGPGEEARAALGPLLNGQAVGGFTLVHTQPNTAGRPVLIYRFPANYVGAGPIVRGDR